MSGFLARVSILILLSTLSTTNCIQFTYGVESEVLRTSDDRIRGARSRENKDFVFGGLVSIHAPDLNSGSGRCGSRLPERGLERMEALLFALDLINNDTKLLPGLEIGYDARDTCASENIGLDEAVDLIVTGSRLNILSCQPCSVMDVNTSTSITPPTSGIVGAANSRVSVPVASLGRLFQMPQISYSASSALLSNRDRYGYFYRTIPPDSQQARAMVDVLLKFNWTYVSAIHIRNTYGEPGIEEFRSLANQNGVCIDLDEGIDDDFDSSDFDYVAESLIKSSANVVIIFGTESTAIPILRRIANTTSATRFTWIASDGWARSTAVTHPNNETAAGLYGIAPLTEPVDQFSDYLSELTIDSNKRNPWFQEYFSTYAECDLSNNSANPCLKNQSVTDFVSFQQTVAPLVIDAVYAFAHALQNFLNDNYQMPIQWVRTNQSCVGQTRELNGSALLEYIAKLDIVNNITGNRIVFDSEGNVEGRYVILNYQASEPVGKKEYAFVRAGTWDGSVTNDSSLQALTLNDSQTLQFGINNDKSIRFVPQPSQCGRCEVGQHRRVVQSSCCGFCEPCLGQMYSTDPMSPNCTMCPAEMWGNNPLVGSDFCVTISESFIRHSDAFSIVVIIFAILGLIAVMTTTVIYIIFWKTPVVKSSGREQMITLLIGIGLIFILAFVYVSPPEPGVCAVQRVGFWICYSIIFGALLVKTVRVTRIFYRPKTLTQVRFTEPHYQVLFTSLIIIGQVVIVIIGLIVVNPTVSRGIRLNRENSNNFPELVVACVVDHPAILVICATYETILIVLSTILGVLSFKYPKNFNEAKFVSFCTFIIAIVWAAFVGLYAYFAVEGRQEIQNAITGLASVLSAYAVLACLFGPKLFIIFFRSEQNKPGNTRASTNRNLDSDVNSAIIRNTSSRQQSADILSSMTDDKGCTSTNKSESCPTLSIVQLLG